jgi:hypothetical protein
MTIRVERIPHNGHLVLTARINGVLFRCTYIGYTKREAMRLFRREVKP